MHEPAMNSGCLGKKGAMTVKPTVLHFNILSLELHTCNSSICEVEGGGSEMGPIGRSLNHGRVPPIKGMWILVSFYFLFLFPGS